MKTLLITMLLGISAQALAQPSAARALAAELQAETRNANLLYRQQLREQLRCEQQEGLARWFTDTPLWGTDAPALEVAAICPLPAAAAG